MRTRVPFEHYTHSDSQYNANASV
ncbi:uncharacterized protein G2W53_010046 [Senna tora]|uniref:Uncharacterized protein n=1 Tax=Senna tora TaxID=362788 RepID=A0A835CDL5_9FABA|nr:uncharacterized protein G2W53_010046 [Senna tora]